MYFEIIGEITDVEKNCQGQFNTRARTAAQTVWPGTLAQAQRCIATVRLATGRIRKVELHWYEAHGIGKKKFKIKRYLD